MVFFIKVEAVTSADLINTKSSIVQKEEKRKHNLTLISIIFKINLKFKMDRRFEKRKLGVINPILVKEPFKIEKQYLEERFILKG